MSKTPAEMTEKEIRDEIFADESSPARERELMLELERRGAARRERKHVDVNPDNTER